MVVECRLKLYLLEEIIKQRLVILESSVADLIPDTGSGLFIHPGSKGPDPHPHQNVTDPEHCASSGGR